MDQTPQEEYKMHHSSQSATQPDLSNQSSTGTDRTAQLVAQLLQAQAEGTLGGHRRSGNVAWCTS